MDEDMRVESRTNELSNLLAQLGDAGAKLAAGLIDTGGYLELRARELAYVAALDALGRGEWVGDGALETLLADMREAAARELASARDAEGRMADAEAALAELAGMLDALAGGE